MNGERTFPIQRGERGVKPHPTHIPWHIAELAYSVYSARYGTSQSLERLADRGGFGPEEMDMFLPDWRERCDENGLLRRALWLACEHINSEQEDYSTGLPTEDYYARFIEKAKTDGHNSK